MFTKISQCIFTGIKLKLALHNKKNHVIRILLYFVITVFILKNILLCLHICSFFFTSIFVFVSFCWYLKIYVDREHFLNFEEIFCKVNIRFYHTFVIHFCVTFSLKTENMTYIMTNVQYNVSPT